MLNRSARTTLLSYTRQRLPRPARLYSTPTHRASAPSSAPNVNAAPIDSYPAYMPPSADAPSGSSSSSHSGPASSSRLGVERMAEMESFLSRPLSVTTLNPPLPVGVKAPTPSSNTPSEPAIQTDTATQDKLAVISACLYNNADVGRAKALFDLLRSERQGDPMLSTKMYNQVMNAYVEMAERETHHRMLWVEEACALFAAMRDGLDSVQPNAGTYAIMLQAWVKFNPDSASPVHGVAMDDKKALLTGIVERGIQLADVVGDKNIKDDATAETLVRLLTRTAVELDLHRVVGELGEVRNLASVDDSLVGVPEVNPVLKAKPLALDQAGNPIVPTAKVEYEVPFNLSSLRKHLAQVSFARQVLPGDHAARQRLLEESVTDVARDRLRHEAEMMAKLELGPKTSRGLQAWMWEWHQGLQARLKDDLPKLAKEEANYHWRKENQRISDFLALVKPEKLSLIVIMELIRLAGSGGVADGMKTARALIAVGRIVEDEWKSTIAKKANIEVPTTRSPPTEGYFSKNTYESLHKRRVVAARHASDAEDWTTEWSQNARVRVGSFLVDALMDVARVDVTKRNRLTQAEETISQPAFFHAYEYQKGHKLGVLKLNPVVAERLAKDALGGTLHPRHLPMLVKPKPWLAHDNGGYLMNKSSAMRFKESQEQLSYLKKAADEGHMEYVFAGLDVLGSTPWKINRGVFDVVLDVWNSGKRLGKMPPAEYEQSEPERPAEADVDPQARSIFQQRLKGWAQARAANHSDRCSVNYKIEIARAFLGDTFYLPHNIDFRGRAYPIPPHLNHIGDDLSRGLLLFSETKPLGEKGLRWLKIHLANLCGFDKASFDERVNWVQERLDEVYDSAEKPLEGRGWWQKADDPWQCLATCMELRAALESPDPLAYESCLPVHQDGTCNGLQHYAALGGDAQGAKQVNLAVTDRPSDVYTYVATMVEKEIAKDLAKGGNKQAEQLAGRVSRKVVKQTVMTTVYGVTYVGAREQIDRQLKARGEIPEDETWAAASYLAKKVLTCIGDLFKGAKGIQSYLNLIAKLISKSIPPDRVAAALGGMREITPAKIAKEQMTSVIWTTPLGLPIVQPYRKTLRKQVMTKIQSVFISDPNTPAGVNAIKQASAFPPNFIHSLDATHMMLTALECHGKGLTFASVHDSYWTHACTIDDMSAIIRDTFIALHQSNVLQRLHDEIRVRYKGYKLPAQTVRAGALISKLTEYNTQVREEREAMLEAGASEEEVQALEVKAAEELKAIEEEIEEVVGAAEEELEVVEDAEAEVEAAVVPKKSKKDKASKRPVGRPGTDTKFVELVDELPELPNKGSFDVTTIKGSAYFFS